MTEGLKPLPRDDRDFKLGAIFTLPKLEELPEEFRLPVMSIFDQESAGEDDFCTAYATCGASSIQEEVDLAPKWSFAVSKMITGDKETWGQDIRSAMKSHVNYGAIVDKWLDEKEMILTPAQSRDINNYRKELFDLAVEHKKKTFFDIVGQFSPYDNIRSAIWKFKDKRQAVVFGIQFSYPLGQYVLDTITQGYGHCMYAIGWNKQGLVVVNSYGKRAGQDGLHIITPNVINHFVPIYGAMMMVDINKENVLYMLEHDIKDTDEWYEEFAKVFRHIIKLCFQKLQKWVSSF